MHVVESFSFNPTEIGAREKKNERESDREKKTPPCKQEREITAIETQSKIQLGRREVSSSYKRVEH